MGAQAALRATQAKLKAATEGLHEAINYEHAMIQKAHKSDAVIAGAEKAAETAKHEHGAKEADAKSAALDTKKADTDAAAAQKAAEDAKSALEAATHAEEQAKKDKEDAKKAAEEAEKAAQASKEELEKTEKENEENEQKELDKMNQLEGEMPPTGTQ